MSFKGQILVRKSSKIIFSIKMVMERTIWEEGGVSCKRHSRDSKINANISRKWLLLSVCTNNTLMCCAKYDFFQLSSTFA